ncbi:hypothetical protein [Pseudoalteromonas sp. S16_S37]|uniref:hypothetical protein n=1 Tax=Pseudoalteromonas sp. S16_S37 TaxID=2720228 RepID=UPI001681475D|nr:hypothetical protein [Pseudoalteromonas sp. S16_S37]MBD1581834.1 hypothetical protein [Pseudoalteromonas sp. S16_S37]
MGLTYSLLAVSLSLKPTVGVLQLQEPVREYYYSRESGTVLHEYALSEEDKVTKGQTLLTYLKTPEQTQRTIVSRTAGYLEYVNSELSEGRHIAAGEMLYKVKSNLVYGWYYIDTLDKKDLKAHSKLWVCPQRGTQWTFNIDAVKDDKVLVSSVVNAKDYNNLYELNQQELVMYHSESACVKSVQ